MQSNVETFVLELKEYLSSGMVKAGAATHGVFEGINSDINRTQTGLNGLGNNVRLNVDSSNLEKAHADIQRVNSEMGLMGTTAAVAAGTMIERSIEQAVTFAKDQIGDVFSKGMQGGAQKMQFEVMAGIPEGDKLFEDLTKMVNDSIFGNELYKEAQTMEAFGVATKDVMHDLHMLGDVSMGNVPRMESLALAFAQTTSAGKLMGQDLLQYVNAGFNPLAEIAAHTGRKMADLRDAMSEGEISAQMVAQAFEWATGEGGKFHNMLGKIAETPYGKKAAMEGNIDNAKQQLGMALLPEVNYFFDQLKPVIDELPGELEKMRPAIAGMVHDFADLVKWTSTHTDTIGKWAGVIKTGVEAWVAWKVATTAMTAANWLWVASVGAQTTSTAESTSAIALQNVELAEQGVLVEALGLKWAAMGAAEREAMLANAGATTAVTMEQAAMAAARNANGAAAGLAGGLAGAATKTVLPVAVMYFAGEAISQMLPQGSFGYDAQGQELKWWDVPGRNDYKMRLAAEHREREKLQQNPVQSATSGWNWSNMTGDAADYNQQLLDKYGVKAPGASTAANGSGKLAETTDAIVGGGPKVVNINLRSLIERVDNHFTNTRDADAWAETTFTEALLKVVRSVAQKM